jgi:hypothetical protein
VVVVNPGTVLGPMIPPAINASMAMFCRLLQGKHIAQCSNLFLKVGKFEFCYSSIYKLVELSTYHALFVLISLFKLMY